MVLKARSSQSFTRSQNSDKFIPVATRTQLRPKAIQSINRKGGLLVYPVKNSKEPASIWSELFPRTPMTWSWDEYADNKVGLVWSLKEELSRSREVVYGKWFKGRATFFSFEVFVHLRAFLRRERPKRMESRQMLETLLLDSPLSTKVLKAELGLQGKIFEGVFNKALRENYEHLDIVTFGEVEDSAFPSAAIGATELLFEDLHLQSLKISTAQAEAYLRKTWPEEHPFLKYAFKIKAGD